MGARINLLARYSATDLARLTGAEVLVLQGGTHGFQVICAAALVLIPP